MPIIKTKDFQIRPFKKGDEASLQKNINNKKIYRYSLTIPYPYTKEHANFWVKHNLELTKKKSKVEAHFALDKNKEVIGGLSFQDIKKSKAELAYWIAEQYWGTGIMQKAIEAFVTYGFTKLKLQCMYVLIFPDDPYSANTLERAGFKYEKTLKQNAKKEGKYIDEKMYVKMK